MATTGKALLLFFLSSATAWADSYGFRPVMTLDEAAQKVARDSNGKIMRATRKKQNDKDVFEVRVLTPDGRRVQHYRLDAESGEIVQRPKQRQRGHR
ncbi:MAG: PepSY domain-containing protein [Gammaproteobacteria bacterium]